MKIYKNGHTLTTLKDWETYAGPKSKTQWKEGRSAKVLGRVWLEGPLDSETGLPEKVSRALKGHQDFGQILESTGEPEVKLMFDNCGGEPRNSDLVVHARDAHGAYLLAVEGKADESYGSTLEQMQRSTAARLLKSPRSQGVLRLQQLCQAFFGADYATNPAPGGLRYQLLTACAGAICEAERRNYSRAVMLVHEFVTEETTDTNHKRNTEDLIAFLDQLQPEAPLSSLKSGSLYGPLKLPGAPLFQGTVALYVGKVTEHLRQPDRLLAAGM